MRAGAAATAAIIAVSTASINTVTEGSVDSVSQSSDKSNHNKISIKKIIVFLNVE